MKAYHFDAWAEYLAVTLAENIARCDLGSAKLQKLRININPDTLWPQRYKALLDNHLVAHHPKQPNDHDDGSLDIQFYYRNPCYIPNSVPDMVGQQFIKKAKQWQPDFYDDAWTLKQNGDGIPALLAQMGLRSLSKILPKQLEHQGIGLTKDFEVQFYDGSNYKSFYYDALLNQLKQSMNLYMHSDDGKKLAAKLCFKRKVNQDWFLSL